MGRLVTTDDVKPYLGTDRSGGSFDPWLNILIGAAEDFVEKEAKRKFSPEPALVGDPPVDSADPVSKSYAPMGNRSVRVRDLRVVTSVVWAGTTMVAANDDFVLINREDEPAYELEFSEYVIPSRLTRNPSVKDLVITGRWGFWPTPNDVRDAVCLIVARNFKERDANYADVVQAGPESAAFSYLRQIPRRAQAVIDHYRIRNFAKV